MKEAADTSGTGRRPASPGRRTLWALPFVWILMAALGVWLAVVSWRWIPYVVATALALALVTWIMVSVLSPAIPDRTCPRCRQQGLVKIRRGEPGVRCERCDFRDQEMHVAYLDEW